MKLVCILVMSAIVALLGQQGNKMMFLHILQIGEKLQVIEADLVDGTPRERSGNIANGPVWESVDHIGTIVETGTIPAPTPFHFDYADDSGKLSGGVLSSDTLDFFVRVPYIEGVELLNFYRTGSLKSRSEDTKIGSIRISEVLK